VGKGKKGGSEGREGKKVERGGEEGNTRHTNPSLLPAPLIPDHHFLNVQYILQ